MYLTPVMKRFVLHWGEMGTRWSVNRTVAQVHALLYLAPAPLPAEEIAETLSVARSNVSTSLKELQSWGLVNVAHVLGDRRDHFVAHSDTWDMLLTILEQRKRREIEPALNVLRECVAEMEKDRNTPNEVKARIDGMRAFLTDLTEWFDQIVKLPRATLAGVMRLGATIGSLAPRSATRA
jgi:DNA-binding transcriptional regulator GbsR (MarR family)